MFESLTLIAIFIVTQFAKKYIVPKWGDTGVHIFVFLLAFAIISAKGLMTTYPTFGAMVMLAGKYLVESLALYKVILKPINEKLNLY